MTFVIVEFDKDTMQQRNTRLECMLIHAAWRIASTMNRNERRNGNRKAYTIQAYSYA